MMLLKKIYRIAFPSARTIQERFPASRIGRGTYGNPRVLSWGEGAQLEIGSYCSIAGGVTIMLGGEHRTDWVTTYPFNVLWESARGIGGHPKTKGDVIIGHDVWIADGAVILSGLRIGSGAVVGCNAVVTRDVPPYGIVAGNPARLIRKRFPDPIIDRLLAARWWDLEEAEISRLLPLMLSDEIERFLEALEGVRSPSR
jgi:acetyltransferase-like isoleucine patch superfamily enzyme